MIKVGFCVAYDWALLRFSIPLIYKEADLICLSLDIERKSWSGNSFTWDEQRFRALIKELDPEEKIKIYEDDFHSPELTPMKNEVRQRKLMASFMGAGGWHLQLDADELFVDFSAFVGFLNNFKTNRRVSIMCPWVTLYKRTPEGFFYVSSEKFSQIEFIQIASQYPEYEYGRRNSLFSIHVNFPILHLSWARSEGELLEKLSNWGHRDDFEVTRMNEIMNKWHDLNESNYKEYKNFNLTDPSVWPALGYVKARDIDSLLHESRLSLRLPITRFELIIRNSIWISRLRAFIRL